MEGDSDANYAHYCLHKLHMLPSTFINLDAYEKAFIIASIDIKVENEKKEQKKLQQKKRK